MVLDGLDFQKLVLESIVGHSQFQFPVLPSVLAEIFVVFCSDQPVLSLEIQEESLVNLLVLVIQFHKLGDWFALFACIKCGQHVIWDGEIVFQNHQFTC